MIRESQWHVIGDVSGLNVLRGFGGYPDPTVCLNIRKLACILSSTGYRSRKKRRYYDAKQEFDNIGIAVPESLSNFYSVLGWGTKAVDMLAERSIFEGYNFRSGTYDVIDRAVQENDLIQEYSEISTSELIGSCSFVTISQGGDYEPEYIVSAYTNEQAAAIWDTRLRAVKCGITVTRSTDCGDILAFNYYDRDSIITFERSEITIDGWYYNVIEHGVKRPLLEAFRNRPTLSKPMGASRITRPVMSLIDSAMRATLRTEIAAEFYTSPQKYLLNVDDDAVAKIDKWKAYLGQMLIIGKGEDDEDAPEYGQLSQMSMNPHIDYLNQLTQMFSSETSINPEALGISRSNPSSAEAIYAMKEDLIVKAGRLNETNGTSMENIGKIVLCLDQNKSFYDLTDEERSISAQFKDPSLPSLVSQADAIVKISSVVPGISESDVVLEKLGFTKEQITRVRNAKKEAEANDILERISEIEVPDARETLDDNS